MPSPPLKTLEHLYERLRCRYPTLLPALSLGVDPSQCLPICVDVGTNNKALLEDPQYKGLRQPRIRGPQFYEFVQEVLVALKTWQPHLLVQFEDFANTTAFKLLETYRHQMCAFNDDIQVGRESWGGRGGVMVRHD